MTPVIRRALSDYDSPNSFIRRHSVTVLIFSAFAARWRFPLNCSSAFMISARSLARRSSVPVAGTFAVGRVTFGGEIQVGDTVTLTIADRVYKVTATADDTVTGYVDNFQFFIENGDDPNVVSEREFDKPNTLLLTARNAGPSGNSIPYSVTVSPGALVTVEARRSTNLALLNRFEARDDGSRLSVSNAVELLDEARAEQESRARTDANDA